MQIHYKKFVQWILSNFSLATEILSMVYLKIKSVGNVKIIN